MIQAKLKSFRELKAEKANRLETWRLQLQLRLMDKESGHRVHLSYLERKNIVRQMEAVRRTTGYSPLSVQPLPADRALKDCPYFTSSQRVSERALRKWRIQEALLERELRLSDLEVRKREEQQAALVRLLIDLGVIGESSQIESLPQPLPALSQGAEQLSRQQQQQQQQQQQKRLQRPFTAAGGAVGPLPPLAEEKVEKRTASAASQPTVKPSQQSLRRGVTFRVDSKREDSPDAVDGAEAAPSAPSMPQWKRQLRYEAPSTLGAQRESARVRLAVSKSALRRELQQLVDAHEKDPTKIAQAEAARREQSRLAMQQTVSHMRRMSMLPPDDHDPSRRGSVPALLQLDRDSSGDDSDEDADADGADRSD